MKNYLLIIFTILSFNHIYSQSMTFEIYSIGTIIVDGKPIGSGFIMEKSNKVVTCEHVIRGQKKVYFRPQQRDSIYELSLISSDSEIDLAVLRSDKDITTKPLRGIKNFNIQPGQHLFYMGYNTQKSTPEIPVYQVDNAFVLATGITKIGNTLVKFIEFEGVGIPGYSGGPVFNDNGGVVAVMTQAWYRQGVKGGRKILINRAFEISSLVE